jgi:hypothetical protein
MVSKEEILLKCPISIFNFEDLGDLGMTMNELDEPFIRDGFIDLDHMNAMPEYTIPLLSRMWGKNENLKLPTIYRIFIDRIEFDLKALEAYLKMALDTPEDIAGVESFPNLEKTFAENDEIPETLFFEDMNDIKLLQEEIKRGWFSGTVTGSNCYEITFRDDKKIVIPLEIGSRHFLRFITRYPKLPKLHLWWKELTRGKIPKDLDLYLKYEKKKIEEAKKHEKLMEFDEAAEVYKRLEMDDDVIRVRKLKAEQGAVKVTQKVVHGDEVTKTEIKDSVLNRSNVGGGSSKMQELKDLTEMKKEGLIDDAEFKQMKKEILGK